MYCSIDLAFRTPRVIRSCLSLAMVVGLLLAAAPVFAQGPDSGQLWYKAAFSTVPLTEEVVGTIQPTTVTTLSSKILGNVVEVLRREGETVAAGDLLVRIDAKEIGSDLQGAQASLAEAQAAIAEVRSQITTAQAAKQAAESELNLAEVSHARIKDLYDKKSVTRQEYDQAVNRLNQARSQVAQATSQIAALQARLAQISARNEQARAGISKVSTLKDLTEVRAPFAGRVVARRVEPGALAAPGVPLMVLEDLGRIRFEAIVPERLLGFLSEGATMAVRIDALGPQEVIGRVVEMVPAGDPLSLTFTVRIALDDDPRLRTGMYARGTVVKGQEQVLLVPISSIERRGQLEGVHVRNQDRAVFRLVKTGRRFGDQIEILSGLAPGEEIRVSPAPR
jgi:multidrug efflux pump subunit AcrA (membrane-fusion protein)